MTISKEHKDWIDRASYTQLLARWRNAPSGDPMFEGDTGDYYAQVMSDKRKAVGPSAHTAASKQIGWDGGM